ncbi:hypothetical protein GTW40_31475 [Streptomyces sp. SID4985]|uniref:hypothetical protein n=1 Tax=Streptomyces sp. SID4985 TaxID=2690292 RepID=UPI00136B6566|nr:hypothetical protein [Streptomyces sp. SID4985]MYQ49490.1 hypothetical protein [Streptomyces sp. SID4985]
MAEHDSDREGREEREPEEPGVPGVPFDEEAAWKAIVAGYGEEPVDPPGSRPFRPIEDLALPEMDPEEPAVATGTDTSGADKDSAAKDGPDKDGDGEEPGTPRTARPLGSSVSFAPGIGPQAGPRDYQAPESSEDDFDEDDEGHFVPPEPPPLPVADTTAKFAWLGVVGGPILLLLAVLLGWEMTWWLATCGIGGFVGGFVTLVTRMRTDDEEGGGDDPGRGAVV